MKIGNLTALVALFLIVPVSAIAQGLPDGVPPEVILSHVLDLSEEQVGGIQQLVEERAAAVEPLALEIHALHQELAEILEGDSPDPVRIGEIILAVRSLEQEIGTLRDEFRAAFHALLTPEQLDRVDHISGLPIALRGAEALGQLGFR